ncbi:uncharacterized protein METZ01_LOCUS91472 [marine metagenome]|uniref:Uncharacterized protein n=1 Tax=marine metagenome TaxID=408172 RepID=A0A381VFS0_9ZZZZ
MSVFPLAVGTETSTLLPSRTPALTASSCGG